MPKSILKKRIVGVLMGSIGFILSPLTWWNDVFINLPLAFGFAYVIVKGLSFAIPVNLVFFLAVMAVGYFLTNVLGFMMMQKGFVNVAKPHKKHNFSWKRNFIYSGLAFLMVVVSIQVGLLDLSEIERYMVTVEEISYLY